MSFNSLSFIFIFFPIVFLLYYCIAKRYKKIYLVVISLLFYTWNEPIYIFGLIALILLNYKWAIKMDRKSDKYRKNYFIWICLLNLFIFLYFKYYDFILQTIFQVFNISITYEAFEAPLGISFFMFSVIGYQIDVYKKKYRAERNLIEYSLFVLFFPKLTMGPIVSYSSWKENDLTITFGKFNKGARRFIIGLGQKVVLAKEMENLFNFIMLQELSFVNAWLMTFAFAFQLYFDFNGYTHMALGLAEIFGFHLPENFNYPYLSTSVSSFWRRWHITLGRWFRDYIYIPLGGNRVSRWKWIRNTLIVWMITGLWHGSQWTFVIWGIYHGIFIILEKLFLGKYLEKTSLSFQIIFTFLVVNIGWVFFYSNNLNHAIHILQMMLQIQTFSFFEFIYYVREYGLIIIICMIASTTLIKNVSHKMAVYKWKPVVEIALMFGIFMISIAFLIGSNYQSFLYSAF